jgi:hypothetical protein
MPGRDLACRVVHRVAGLGCLGRERLAAIAEWHGAILYQEILDAAVRCPDPFTAQCGPWILRRLAPDCSRIELSDIPKERDETRLLHAMGWETANVHLGSVKPEAVLKDLKSRPGHWLHDAAGRMMEAVAADWKQWRKK